MRLSSASARGAHAASLRAVDVMLCCSRTSFMRHHAERLGQLARDGVDWQLVLGLARKHGVVPLVHRNLRAAAVGELPPEILQTLRVIAEINALHGWQLAAHLVRLTQLFDGSGINALSYRGAVLAASVYGGLEFRQFADLDFVVRQADIPHAKMLLESAGFHRKAHPAFALHMANEGLGLSVELHHEFCEPRLGFRLRADHVRAASEPVVLLDRRVNMVHPEDLLLLLCVNGSRDMWVRLGKICDVAEVVGKMPGIAWDAMLHRARAFGGDRMLLMGLSLAQDLLGIALPDEIIRATNAQRHTRPRVQKIARRIRTHSNASSVPAHRRVNPLPLLAYTLRRHHFLYHSISHASDRSAYLLHFLKPGTFLTTFMLLTRPAFKWWRRDIG